MVAIGQDAKGFIWISTLSGLNRFDGVEVKSYSHIPGDTNSIPASIIRAMALDSNGIFLAGLEDGLMEYDPQQNKFNLVPALKGFFVDGILPVKKDVVYLGTDKGLIKYNPVKKTAIFYNDDERFNRRIYNLTPKGDIVYIGNSKGLYALNIYTGKVSEIFLPGLDKDKAVFVCFDANNNMWVTTTGVSRLLKISPGFKQYELYDKHLKKGLLANIYEMVSDARGRVWIATQLDGVLMYDPVTNKMEKFLHDPLRSWTPSTNLHGSLFCDREGRVWVAGNNGINYVNPDKNLFQVIPAFDKDPDILNRRVARVSSADSKGNLWFGTLDGLVRYNLKEKKYTEWNNREGSDKKIHYNSVRGVLVDKEENTWIATGGGLNKYLPAENKMLFFDEADSIPRAFYFSADMDREGNLWFGCKGYNGFYYYKPSSKTFHSISSHPFLQVFKGNGGRKFLHDSKGKYWLGFNGQGLGMYDPATKKSYHWLASGKENQSISGNIIVDIIEDKNGMIWVSTFNGLTSINPANQHIKNYNNRNGLINNSTSSLAVDAFNRLWIGTGGGLMMLDSSRRFFTSFGLADGLPSIEFPEHASYTTTSGQIIMGTQNGYIIFDPLSYSKENKPLSPFINSFSIAGSDRHVTVKDSGSYVLNHTENFFTIGFSAIQLDRGNSNWYAYKLEGVDEDWIYTQNRYAVYTKLAGGNYIFKLKASTDRETWTGPELSVPITIKSIFYQTVWFRLILLLLAISLIYFLYRTRLMQQRKMLELKSKAQLLEKEKVLVMYESLKQQLNPHFLFNSLTSLSGLIETDQQMAGNFLEQMSKIYRYILKNRDSELVSLKEELNFVQVYINLQKTRFREGLKVNINVSPEDHYKKIAPVTIQNLLENAIKHNIIDKDNPLVVDIYSGEDYLIVTNNLQKKNMVETSNQQGLGNLRSLYEYLSPRPILVKETDDHFSVHIPLIDK